MTHTVNEEVVAILDAGSQYGKLIDRVVRELNVESELVPFNASVEKLAKYKAIIVSGGPESVYSPNAPAYDAKLFEAGIPTLGICYGMQLMCYTSGGKVEKREIREDGQLYVDLVGDDSQLFDGLDKSQKVLLTHGDTVTEVGNGFNIIARSRATGIISGIESPEKKLYGVQFHPEVQLTENGKNILQNFLYKIAGCSGSFTIEDREKSAIDYIQKTIGNKKALVLASGGVDSTVVATLVGKAIGPEKVIALHIDNGFMRKNESSIVEKALAKLNLPLRVVDASEQFYNSKTTINGKETGILKETVHPEEKRKIIGDTFMKVAEIETKKLGLEPDDVFLVQGTLRPDLIESASKLASTKADAIKTHHNDTELVRLLREQGRVIEPLKDLHKDEVRELGKRIGLPEDLVWRQPFPGPGLAIRIICAEEPFKDETFEKTNDLLAYLLGKKDLPEVAAKYKTEIESVMKANGIEDLSAITNGIYATLLPIKTVGVQGDGRSYRYLCGLSGTKNWDHLLKLARTIPQICHNVNRVVYIFGDAVTGPVTDITPTHCTPNVIHQLQEADSIVNTSLFQYDLIRKLSQVPCISFPVHFGTPGNRSIAIRTFITNDFMTGVVAKPGVEMPEKCLEEMVQSILTQVPGISRVVYDLTSKPPGTTEWE